MLYEAILLGYRRPRLLREAVDSLRRQSAPPLRITVWHNAPSRVEIPGARNIFADRNYGCRARHVAGLLSECAVCLFMDDDLILGPDVVRKLLLGHARHPLAAVGYVGRRVSDAYPGKYTRALEVRSGREDEEVSIVKGRLHLVRKSLLYCIHQYDLPEDVAAEDDIVLNAAVRIQTGHRPWVIGGIGRNEVQNVASNNGLEHRPDHWQRRDAAWQYMRKHFRWEP